MIIDSKKYDGLCSCGKTHKMETLFCLIENGCLYNIDKYTERYGLSGYSVAVYDENTYKATKDRHPQVDLEVVLSAENLHADEHGVELLLSRLPEKIGYLIAVGSGTIHDITRYCAYQKNIDFVSCPTAASVDGFCSSVAAMTWKGCKKTMTAVAPKIVIADLEIIKNAPIHLAKSGFGDMVGKYIALTDWKIANIITKEFYCDRIAQMTFDATQEVINSINGIIAHDESAYEKLIYGLLLSGLAMQMMGNSRPASGAEHHISHIIEMEPELLEIHSEALHGEKVGVGTLIVLDEYQKIAKNKKNMFFDYEGFSKRMIEDVFEKEMSQEIIDENQNDVAQDIRSQTIKNKFDDIVFQIEKLPNIKDLAKIYHTAGIKSDLSDINVSSEKRDLLLNYAPMVRNRLTLLRIISGGAIKKSNATTKQ